MESDEERWVPVIGWETRYSVSTKGRVRSKDMQVPSRKGYALRRGRVLKQAVKGNGYTQVTLTRPDGQRVSELVHRIVAASFYGICPANQQVCHRNGIKTDNRLSNLYYGTVAENTADRYRMDEIARGTRHGCSVLTDTDVMRIRSETSISAAALAAQYGVTKHHIYSVRSGRSWRHLPLHEGLLWDLLA